MNGSQKLKFSEKGNKCKRPHTAWFHLLKIKTRQNLAVYPFGICFEAIKVKAGNDEHKDKMMVMTVRGRRGMHRGKMHKNTEVLGLLFFKLHGGQHNYFIILLQTLSVQFSRSVVSNTLLPHGLQHAMLPCPSPTPRACSNSCPSNRWCHPTISSSVILFSSCPQSFPASGSFPVSQFFASGSQSTGASASTSVLPMNTQDWSPLGWTSWISLQSKGLSRVFSNTTVQKHQFFSAQLSL